MKMIRNEIIKYCVGQRVNEIPLYALSSVVEDIRMIALHDMRYQDEVLEVLYRLRDILGVDKPRPSLSVFEHLFGPSKSSIENLARYEAAQYLGSFINDEIKHFQKTTKPMKWVAELEERFADSGK